MKNEKRISELKEKSEMLDRRFDAFKERAMRTGGFNSVVSKQTFLDKQQSAIWAEIDKLKK